MRQGLRRPGDQAVESPLKWKRLHTRAVAASRVGGVLRAWVAVALVLRWWVFGVLQTSRVGAWAVLASMAQLATRLRLAAALLAVY